MKMLRIIFLAIFCMLAIGTRANDSNPPVLTLDPTDGALTAGRLDGGLGIYVDRHQPGLRSDYRIGFLSWTDFFFPCSNSLGTYRISSETNMWWWARARWRIRVQKRSMTPQ